MIKAKNVCFFTIFLLNTIVIIKGIYFFLINYFSETNYVYECKSCLGDNLLSSPIYAIAIFVALPCLLIAIKLLKNKRALAHVLVFAPIAIYLLLFLFVKYITTGSSTIETHQENAVYSDSLS